MVRGEENDLTFNRLRSESSSLAVFVSLSDDILVDCNCLTSSRVSVSFEGKHEEMREAEDDED